MDEITKLKADSYDILVQIQNLQALLQNKSQRIAELEAQPNQAEKK